MNFGEKITLLRNLKGLSKRQVGDAIGTSDVSIHRYENGVRPKRPEVYEKLARLFGCTVEELTDDSVDLLPKDLQEITEEEKDSQKSTDDKKAPAKAKAEQPTPAEKAKAEKPKKADSVNEKPVEDTTEKSAPEEKSSEPAPDKTAPTEFGKRLSSLLKAKNLTLAQVADKIGVTLNTYKGMEYKNTRPTDPKVYNKLAKVLGCDVEYLREGDKRFEKKEAPVKDTEKPAPKKSNQKANQKPKQKSEKKADVPAESPITTQDLGEIEENIPEEPIVSVQEPSSSSEVIRLVSKLSVLLAGDSLSQSEKDAVMASLNGAYWNNRG